MTTPTHKTGRHRRVPYSRYLNDSSLKPLSTATNRRHDTPNLSSGQNQKDFLLSSTTAETKYCNERNGPTSNSLQFVDSGNSNSGKYDLVNHDLSTNLEGQTKHLTRTVSNVRNAATSYNTNGWRNISCHPVCTRKVSNYKADETHTYSDSLLYLKESSEQQCTDYRKCNEFSSTTKDIPKPFKPLLIWLPSAEGPPESYIFRTFLPETSTNSTTSRNHDSGSTGITDLLAEKATSHSDITRDRWESPLNKSYNDCINSDRSGMKSNGVTTRTTPITAGTLQTNHEHSRNILSHDQHSGFVSSEQYTSNIGTQSCNESQQLPTKTSGLPFFYDCNRLGSTLVVSYVGNRTILRAYILGTNPGLPVNIEVVSPYKTDILIQNKKDFDVLKQSSEAPNTDTSKQCDVMPFDIVDTDCRMAANIHLNRTTEPVVQEVSPFTSQDHICKTKVLPDSQSQKGQPEIHDTIDLPNINRTVHKNTDNRCNDCQMQDRSYSRLPSKSVSTSNSINENDQPSIKNLIDFCERFIQPVNPTSSHENTPPCKLSSGLENITPTATMATACEASPRRGSLDTPGIRHAFEMQREPANDDAKSAISANYVSPRYESLSKQHYDNIPTGSTEDGLSSKPIPNVELSDSVSDFLSIMDSDRSSPLQPSGSILQELLHFQAESKTDSIPIGEGNNGSHLLHKPTPAANELESNQLKYCEDKDCAEPLDLSVKEPKTSYYILHI